MIYETPLFRKFVHLLMKNGNKQKARNLLCEALESMKKDRRFPSSKTGLEVLSEGVLRASPLLEVRKIRLGGTYYNVPGALHENRQQGLGIRWLIVGATKRKPMKFAQALGCEILEASRREGYAVRQRDELHKLAESNRAFAHYRWWT